MKFWFLFLLLLPSCATTENYKKIVVNWVGKDANSLIFEWGPPQSEFKAPNGDNIYTWKTRGAGDYENYWCDTTFTVDQKSKIIAYRISGNACIAHSPKEEKKPSKQDNWEKYRRMTPQ